MFGRVEIDGDLIAPGRIHVPYRLVRANGGVPPNIHVHGSIVGNGTAPVIEIGPGGLGNDGTIAIDGSLENAVAGPEIRTTEIDEDNRGGIAVDYDGWHAADVWEPGATVEEFDINGEPVGTYHGNDPDNGVYLITQCIGDLDNNELLNLDDVAALDQARLLFLTGGAHRDCFADNHAGLEGSALYHGDLNCDGDVNCVDLDWLKFLVEEGELTCCVTECQELTACRADFDRSGVVDLGDLGRLLAAFGPCEGEPGFDPVADLNFGDCDPVPECNNGPGGNADNCVNLIDLGIMLAVFGEPCSCFAGEGFGGQGAGAGGGTSASSNSFVPRDTAGHTRNGFRGEVDHFVFDLIVDATRPSDDWTTCGALLTAHNEAAFRLSSAPSAPDAYATFVGSPGAPLPGGSGTTWLAGAYQPSGPRCRFDETGINVVWFDTVESQQGPAAVMRLVIDVSAVPGANTSGGLGSVYFSQSGLGELGDIKVADSTFSVMSKFGAENTAVVTGVFFVKAQ